MSSGIGIDLKVSRDTIATLWRARNFSSPPTRPRMSNSIEARPRRAMASSSTSVSPRWQGRKNSQPVLTIGKPTRRPRCISWKGCCTASRNQSSTIPEIISKKLTKKTIPAGSQCEKRIRRWVVNGLGICHNRPMRRRPGVYSGSQRRQALLPAAPPPRPEAPAAKAAKALPVRKILAFAAAGLLLVALGWWTAPAQRGLTPQDLQAAIEQAFEERAQPTATDAYEVIRPSVVRVRGLPEPGAGELEGFVADESVGTGVVI